MNKFAKISIIIIGIALLLGAGVYVKLFYIGSKDYSNVEIEKVVVSSDNLTIYGEFVDSSRAYKDYSYRLVGTELYVSLNSVLVSKKYSSGSFEINLPINGIDVENVHLTDDKSTKVIYSK